MSLIERERGGTIQILLQLTGKQFYLGTKDRIDPDRVYASLDYLRNSIEERNRARYQKDMRYFVKVHRTLEGLLPKEERRRLQTREEIPTLQVAKVAELGEQIAALHQAADIGERRKAVLRLNEIAEETFGKVEWKEILNEAQKLPARRY